MITPEQFSIACDSLAGYFGVIGMFGGNPCIHPKFDELCAIMREKIPFEQRGLWSNNLNGHGKTCRETFNPKHSNLNVHMVPEAAFEMQRDWPEAAREVKGFEDSRHTPVYVAMQDVDMTDEERWRLIGECDVNQYWSAMIGVFRGELRAWFCEIAGAQSMLHQNDPNYPDTGLSVVPGWWDKPMSAFESQVRWHCMACGFPLRGHGALAVNGDKEQCSKTHADVYKPKQKGREVELVSLRSQLGDPLKRGTDYLENGGIK
jgi:hypothetical protein